MLLFSFCFSVVTAESTLYFCTMETSAFVTSLAVTRTKQLVPIKPVSGSPGRVLTQQVARSRRCGVTMREKDSSSSSNEYVIKQSEYVDPGSEYDDDSGDGFMGESAMDDMLGLSMPDDLAGFEKREIMNSKSRDELVTKLKDIASRRKDIRADRRRGIGMENVENYLGNL